MSGKKRMKLLVCFFIAATVYSPVLLPHRDNKRADEKGYTEVGVDAAKQSAGSVLRLQPVTCMVITRGTKITAVSQRTKNPFHDKVLGMVREGSATLA